MRLCRCRQTTDESPRQVMTYGNQTQVRTIVLQDKKDTIKAPLWRKVAGENITVGSYITGKNLLTEYGKEKQLSTTSRTKIELREAPIAMDCTLRVRLQAQAAIAEANLHLAQANLNIHQYAQNRMRRRRQRRWWYRAWLGPARRRKYGLYDQLMVELRREDTTAFTNFLRMPPAMFDELLTRVGPRITKQRTYYRAPIEPGMKLAITLRHLASGSKYTDMRYGWRVPHNTISLIVREVGINCEFVIQFHLFVQVLSHVYVGYL
ncbi:hypothetical protein HOLleu_43780 [Holothuria leucospilota]|uniref:Uncharacterized protein n=1 Tax=Holothuria leucospilota TaxID=206669 RepID=A0A9Q1BAJ8_HOLLE|nr:hypothetical protein HOLleu_43780 [Holothuria leucospilota]